MKYIFTLIVICCGALLAAQSDSTSRTFANSPVYVQAGLGVLISSDLINAEISGSIGYRFGKAYGLGFEYRSTTTNRTSFGDNAKVLGIQIRRQYQNGMLTSLGGGTILEAFRGYDGFEAFEYRSGGFYLATDIGYQFRWGLTLGGYVTTILNPEFELTRYDDITEEYEPTGQINPYSFASFGLIIGFAFPMRGKRR